VGAGRIASVLLADVAATSRAVAATSARNAKIGLLAEALRAAGPDVAVVVRWLAGDLTQRRTGVGWATLRDAAPPAATAPALTVAEVDAEFESIAGLSGTGSGTERGRRVHALFARATGEEQAFLRGLVTGELRQGALDGLMVEAIAKAAELPTADVRRAAMLCGAPAPVAQAALTEGAAGLARFRLEVGRPLLPMLAGTAASATEAVEKLGTAAIEWKLDGIRVQVHRSGPDVAVFSRSLDDITARVPEIVASARTVSASAFVLDGEALALRPDQSPLPFQDTGGRAATRSGTPSVPLSWFAFDVLHLDGADLLDRAGSERYDAMATTLPAELMVPRLVTSTPAEAEQFFADTVGRGHEGVVAKSLDAPYEAGRRGTGWLKVKPVYTLDLVVLAAEWGHGRRRGWLSNLHLGARDPVTGGFVMLGKTFKGMTDEMLRWQTEKFRSIETSSNDWVVHVEPSVAVEIAFDGVQRSTRYPGGVALRFARVLRYRDDKRPEDADTIDAVRAFLSDRPQTPGN
jgi:ATP-dependent DNA ligase I